MKRKGFGCLLGAAIAAFSAAASPGGDVTGFGPARTFAIDYAATVPFVPPGARRLRVWLPVPRDSAAQRITGLSFSRPPLLSIGPRFGNRFAYWEVDHPEGETRFSMHFVCTRREVRTDLGRLEALPDGRDPAPETAEYLAPSRMGIVDGRVARLAAEVTAGEEGTVAKARAIYEYVLSHMRYDKTRPGWGRGSTAYACDNGRGNCTDFHSLFISLCQAAGIPAEFEIGLYLPYRSGPPEEPLRAYHCWVHFRVPGRAWVPVDCSEASLQPARRNFFFGGYTNNRVTLSVGRDLSLVPAQNGPPLNYFVAPYAEADGRPVPAEKSWSYREIGAGGGSKT